MFVSSFRGAYFPPWFCRCICALFTAERYVIAASRRMPLAASISVGRHSSPCAPALVNSIAIVMINVRRVGITCLKAREQQARPADVPQISRAITFFLQMTQP